MHKYLNPKDEKRKDFTHLARGNRRAPSEAEKKLWNMLRGRRFSGWKFRRQHQLRTYIVDFVCLEKRLIIELDGGQHNLPEMSERDAKRTNELREWGFRMLRFWNYQLFQECETVEEIIHNILEGRKEDFLQ